MTRFLALLAAGLLATAAAAATLPAPEGAVEVEAGSISYDAAEDRYHLEGGVRLRRGAVQLRARTAGYLPATGTVEAAGEVLLTVPGRAVAAESARLVLDGPWEAREVVAFVKDGPLDLGAAGSGEAARRAGRNRLALRAKRLSGEGGDRFRAEGVTLTLCDCGEGPPSWEIGARSADIWPGERATLTLAVLRVTPRFLLVKEPVPVLPLPWLYLPLADRRTGLLLPGLHYGSRTGWTLSLPLFVTLGRSLDVTATLEHAFGPSGAPGGGRRAVAGTGGSLELRWAPAPGAAGRAELEWLRDLRRDPGDPSDGNRIAFWLEHAHRPGERADVAVGARLVNDPLYLEDLGGDVLARSAPYLRSAAALSHRGDEVVVAAETGYHLGIGSLGQPGVPAAPFGLFGSRVPSFHRLPAASALLLPVRLLGPLRVSAALGAARFAPLEGATNRAGADGLGPGDRGWAGLVPVAAAWTPGQRLAAGRLGAEAEVRAPAAVGRALSVEPWLRGRALGYAFAAGESPSLVDAWAAGGLLLSTRLSRVFGQGPSRVRHDLEPRVEWRGGTGTAGPALPAYAYDELDRPAAGTPCAAATPGCLPLRTLSAAPPGRWSQLRLALRNRLVVPSGQLSRAAVDLDAGQDVDLGRGSLAETWVRGGVAAGPLSAGVTTRFLAFGARPPRGAEAPAFPSWLDRFTELRVDLALTSARGDQVHGALLAVGQGASGRLRSGLDPLFDDRAVPFEATAQASAGARARVAGGLDVAYDALFNVRTAVAPGCDAGRAPVTWQPHLQQHAASLAWSSPCRCWRAAVRVRISDCGDWGVGAALDLGELAGLRFPR